MNMDEQEKRITFETFNGVEVEIVKVSNSSLFKITNAKGGALAEGLEGMWTTPQKAKEALDDYNIKGKQTIVAKEAEVEAKEQAIKELVEAPTTTENYAKQRIEKLKQEKTVANA